MKFDVDKETDNTEGGQFIKDKKLGELVRKIQKMFDDSKLRPLEKELVTLIVYDRLMRDKNIAMGMGMIGYGLAGAANISGHQRDEDD